MQTDRLEEKAGGRIYWIECIRVFSAFLVVMQHSLSGVWTTLPPETWEWKVINAAFLLSRCAVPVFFMCSGMGMLEKERSLESIFKKNIGKVLKLYVLWMLVYGVRDGISLVMEGSGSVRTIINAFLKDILFGQYHTWFIMTLIGLYLITPFLYEIVRREKYLKYFLALSILFTVVLPAIGSIEDFERLNAAFETVNMRFVTGWVMYYVLGYYLSRITWSYSRKKAAAIAGIVFFLSYLSAFYISSAVSAGSGEAVQTAYGEFAPLGLLVNTSLLMLFRILISSGEAKKWAVVLGSCGGGIYLMHPLLLPVASCFSGISRAAGGVLVYLMALAICLVIGKISRAVFKSV